MIVLDTSILIHAFAEAGRLEATLIAATERGERLALCAPVLYEWRRGPRTERELAWQEAAFPAEAAWPFGASEALVAAELYRRVSRGRQREFDLAIAACALTHDARLWTSNARDFADIPDLTLFDPAARA